jgi:hypothetical protein
MTNEFILGDWWLDECISRLENHGASREQILEYARSWELAAIRYGCWLYDEGFDFDQSVIIVNQAIDESDFDLSKFPVCNGV